MPAVVRGKFKKPRWRRLRTYERIAHEQHDCSACPNPIEPGDQYQGEVWLWETRDYGTCNKLEVRKYHLECPEDPEEERRRNELEEEFERDCEERYEESEPEEVPMEQPQVA